MRAAPELGLGQMASTTILGLSKKFRWQGDLDLETPWPGHLMAEGPGSRDSMARPLGSGKCSMTIYRMHSFLHSFNFFYYPSRSPKRTHEIMAKHWK